MPLPPSMSEPSDPPRRASTSSSLPQPPAAPQPPPSGLATPTGPPTSGAQTERATCYQHPDRVAGRRCTRCGKPACAECLVQATVGSHCLDCAKAAEPDVRTKIRYWQASKPAIVTYGLIVLNVAVFVVLGLAYDFGGMLVGDLTEAHLKFGLNEVFLQGETVPITQTYVTDGSEWYRLVTSGFLHFGIIHLGLNMLFLYALGNQLEPRLGRSKFALLYFASLFGGAAGVLIVDANSIAAGASGAVFGLMGAYAAGIWQHGVNPLGTWVGSLLLINLVLTFAIPRISIGGHIGGLVAGALCGYLMLAPNYKPVPAWAKWAAPVVVGAGSVAASVLAVA